MRRVFVVAVAALFALALPGLAVAQEHEHEDHKGPPPGAHPGGPPGPPHKLPPGPHGPMGGPPHPPGPPGAMGGPSHPGGPPGPQFSYHGHQFNRFHASHPFIYPPGWGYRRWAAGAILPPLFLVPDYYFMGWADLGLPPPPPGDQWVRYGPDLLLVDVSTGQVVDAIYDAFY